MANTYTFPGSFQYFCEENKIIQQMIVPYISLHNGIDEKEKYELNGYVQWHAFKCEVTK